MKRYYIAPAGRFGLRLWGLVCNSLWFISRPSQFCGVVAFKSF